MKLGEILSENKLTAIAAASVGGLVINSVGCSNPNDPETTVQFGVMCEQASSVAVESANDFGIDLACYREDGRQAELLGLSIINASGGIDIDVESAGFAGSFTDTVEIGVDTFDENLRISTKEDVITVDFKGSVEELHYVNVKPSMSATQTPGE